MRRSPRPQSRYLYLSLVLPSTGSPACWAATVAAALAVALTLLGGALFSTELGSPPVAVAQTCPPPGSLGDPDWTPTQHTTVTIPGSITAGPNGDPKGFRASPPWDMVSYHPANCQAFPTAGNWPTQYYRYDAYQFSVATSSDPCDVRTWWRFSTSSSQTGGLGDTSFSDVLSLYRNCFDPLNPLRNLVAVHVWEGLGGGIPSFLVLPLNAGTYVLVDTTESFSTASDEVGGTYTIVANRPIGETTPFTPTSGCQDKQTQCQGLLNCTDNVFTRPRGLNDCYNEGNYAYEQYAFAVTSKGWWSFSTCGDTNLVDTMLFLYRDTMDCANLVALNDNWCGKLSRLSVELDVGNYLVVVTTYPRVDDSRGVGVGYYTLTTTSPTWESFSCARGQSLPAKAPPMKTGNTVAAKQDSDVKFKQNQGSIELPTQACFSDWQAALVGMTEFYQPPFIEAGAVLMAEKYRTSPVWQIRQCIDRYCAYSTADNAPMAFDVRYGLVPGARPWFRLRRTSDSGGQQHWATDWSINGGQDLRPLLGTDTTQRPGYTYIGSGLEFSTQLVNPKASAHEHKDNFMLRVSGGTGLLPWIYNVPKLGLLPSTLSSCMTLASNCWKQSVP